MVSTPSARSVHAIRSRLLDWYDRSRRPLPWREDRDPYRVWVSEIMLQQTRVEAVRPYFDRWMERFPDLESLAGAEMEDVLRVWAGLGYYSRARNLHRAARIVRDRHAGRVPDSAAALIDLPGIGPYSAGAIASIAFDRPEPAVDGNVRRVLSRLFDIEAPTAVDLHGLASELVTDERPGDLNQALMELGARVCTPRAPRCSSCPVARSCRARSRGSQEARPVRMPKAPVPRFRIGTAVISGPDGTVLLVRRPLGGLLAGLWEFPGAVTRPREGPAAAARRAFATATGHTAAAAAQAGPAPLPRVSHRYSHRHHVYHPYRFDLAGAGRKTEPRADGLSFGWTEAAWTRPVDLRTYPLPAAQLRIAAAAGLPHPREITAGQPRSARRRSADPAGG